MSESDSLAEPSNASNQHAWDEDVALMARIAKGEDAAMSLLVNRWKGPLTRFFNKSLHSLTDAEELTQNTFVKIYRAADRYKPIAKFSTYLFTIARRVLLDEIKRKARHPLDPTDPLELRGESSPVGKMRRAELQEVLEQCLQNLPEKQRTALLLRVQRELTYDDIASIMKVSQGAVKTWIHRARSHLRKNLKPLL